VISVIALAAAWFWEGQHEAAAVPIERPEEIDPFAGGYPVPPMPGQRLREPSRQAARSLAGSAGHAELTDQEEPRG
jgi:NADH-quinone oxidoreductase subunit H